MYLDPVSTASWLVVRGDLQSVDDTGDITQDGEKDVDEEVTSTSTFEEDTQRWEDDGNDDFADVSVKLVVSALSQKSQLVSRGALPPASAAETQRQHSNQEGGDLRGSERHLDGLQWS